MPELFVKCHSLQASYNEWKEYAKLNSLSSAPEAQNQCQFYTEFLPAWGFVRTSFL